MTTQSSEPKFLTIYYNVKVLSDSQFPFNLLAHSFFLSPQLYLPFFDLKLSNINFLISIMALSSFSGSSDSARLSKTDHPIWDLKVIVIFTVMDSWIGSTMSKLQSILIILLKFHPRKNMTKRHFLFSRFQTPVSMYVLGQHQHAHGLLKQLAYQ